MPDPRVIEETWTEWVKRQQEDPESTTHQLMARGVSLDTALIINMLGKIHQELIELNSPPEPEDWQRPDEAS